MPYFTKCKHNKRLIQRDSPSLRFSQQAATPLGDRFSTSHIIYFSFTSTKLSFACVNP